MSKLNKDVFQEGVENYSINLLWINDKKHVDQEYIHTAKTSEELITKFLTPAIKWAKENPADINIWYDSMLHETQSVLNTQKILVGLASQEGCNTISQIKSGNEFQDKDAQPTLVREHSLDCADSLGSFSNGKWYNNIKLRDIRDINIVNQNSILFSDEMSLYFRIDLLKMIICLYSLKDESKDAAIFSDLEVGNLRIGGKKMDKNELFDQDSMAKLKTFGIVTNALENQFIQVINDDTVISALRHSINACLMRGTDTLNMPVELQARIMPRIHIMPFYSTVFEVSQYYMGTKRDTIEVRADFLRLGPKDQWIKYDPEAHGYKPLGNYIPTSSSLFSFLDFSVSPYELYSKIITFGVTRDDCAGFRETHTRHGRSHIDDFIVPKEGHPLFTCKFWEKDPVYNLSSHAEGIKSSTEANDEVKQSPNLMSEDQATEIENQIFNNNLGNYQAIGEIPIYDGTGD